MEIYKNWEIAKSDYATGYYEAINLDDFYDFFMYAKSVELLKVEIDEISDLKN